MKQITFITCALAMMLSISCDTSRDTTQVQKKTSDKVMVEKQTMRENTADATASAKESMNNTASEMKNKANSMMGTGGTITWAAANDRYSAEGDFKNWYFTNVDMDKGNMESLTASLSVDLTSIWEKNPKLTDHLKAPDFFNIEKYTTANLDIMNVKSTGDGMYTADMKLNMKGLSQDMVSEFKVTSMDPLHVTGTAKVNRSFFSLGGDGMGVGEFVTVTYDTDIPN